MKKTLVWRFDDEVDRMPMKAVRLTVRTVTMRDYGEFQRLTRLATQMWEDKFPLLGENGAEQAGESGDAADRENIPAEKEVRPARADGSGVFLDIYRRWARLAAATATVEVLGGLGAPPPSMKGKKGQQQESEAEARTEVDWNAAPDTWPWSPYSLFALGWDKPDPIMDLPTDFFFTWEQAVLDVNPGVWGTARTSDAPDSKKKTGLVALY